MDTNLVEKSPTSKNVLDVLSFERKLVELVEELRLRRNIETENEKTLKNLMDEKYKAETDWDEQHRKHLSEKAELEQQISLLKRKLEDKVCVSDDEKVKQQMANKTYSQEIRALKEELRNSNSEKLNFTKRIQELEGQLKIHSNFQETIVSQFGEIRKRMKTLMEESQELTKVQTSVMENVSEAKIRLQKLEHCNEHLQHVLSLAERKNDSLKKKLIGARSELTTIKYSLKAERRNVEKFDDIKKCQERNAQLENLLLISRKEIEKTMHNFVEANNLLCKFMNKYADARETEKTLKSRIDNYESELETWKGQTEELHCQLTEQKEKQLLLVRRKMDVVSRETQTENVIDPTVSDLTSIETHEFLPLHELSHITSRNTSPNSLLNDPLKSSKNGVTGTSKFLSPNEASTFREIMKQKHGLSLDDDSSDAPLKKRQLSSFDSLGAESNWAIKNQTPRLQVHQDDDDILSSLNQSQESNFNQSQESSFLNESTIGEIERKSSVNENEDQMSDLVSVQINLKDLKVNDPNIVPENGIEQGKVKEA